MKYWLFTLCDDSSDAFTLSLRQPHSRILYELPPSTSPPPSSGALISYQVDTWEWGIPLETSPKEVRPTPRAIRQLSDVLTNQLHHLWTPFKQEGSNGLNRDKSQHWFIKFTLITTKLCFCRGSSINKFTSHTGGKYRLGGTYHKTSILRLFHSLENRIILTLKSGKLENISQNYIIIDIFAPVTHSRIHILRYFQ